MSELAVPIVSCDARLGVLVKDVEIDSGRLATLLRERGVTEEQIAESTFHFSADAPRNPEDPDKIRRGICKYDTKVVTVYLGHFAGKEYETVARAADEAVDAQIDSLGAEDHAFFLPDDRKTTKADVIDTSFNYRYNQALIHELDHLVEAWSDGPAVALQTRLSYQNKLYWRRQVKSSLLALLGAGALAVPLVELYERVDPGWVEKTSIPALVIAGISFTLANRLDRRRLSDPLTHGEYVKAPWEVAARKFAGGQVPLEYAARETWPLQAVLKPIDDVRAAFGSQI